MEFVKSETENKVFGYPEKSTGIECPTGDKEK